MLKYTKQAKELFDVEEYTRSDVICRELLMNADLPVLYKAGAHLLLAGGGDNELYHARQVRNPSAMETPGAERVADSF